MKPTHAPARVILVHDDLAFLTAVAGKLRDGGYDVAAFKGSISAFDALRNCGWIDVLVTRVAFPPGQPHGIALAGAARINRPSLKVIFLARPDVAHEVMDESRVLIMPVSPDQVVQAVEELLNAPPTPGL